ncbi:MAG: hypothetical protein PUC18_12970 [Prevotellaceae bacterium]|nr:hypothetical protein [Prevotellaceae bacterium]
MKIIKIPQDQDMKVEVVEHWENGKLVNTRVLKKKVMKDNFCHECKFFSYNVMGAGFCGRPLIKGEGQRVPKQQYNKSCDNFELRNYGYDKREDRTL